MRTVSVVVCAVLASSCAADAPAPTPQRDEPKLPPAGVVVATIELDGAAQGVAEAGGRVWVGLHHGGGVVPINPATNEPGKLVLTGSRPGSLTADNDSLWVANYGSSPEDVSVTRVDPDTGVVTAEAAAPKLPDLCCDPALGAGRLWVPTAGAATLVGVDANTGRVTEKHTPGTEGVGGVAFAQGLVWIDDGTGSDSRILGLAPDSGDAIHTVDVGNSATPSASDGATVWGLSVTGAFAIDATMGGLIADVPVDANYATLSVGLGSVWVAGSDGGKGVLYRIDPATEQVVGRTELDVIPSRVLAGSESVWVTSFDDNAVVRVEPA